MVVQPLHRVVSAVALRARSRRAPRLLRRPGKLPSAHRVRGVFRIRPPRPHPMPSYPRASFAWLIALLALTSGQAASTFLTDGYSVRVWQTEDGLPENLVTSAAQTRDGYLWFGTFSGLVRFDGERFRVFNPTNAPELPDRRVVRLFEDSMGVLWIGHEAGHVSRYHQGRFERVDRNGPSRFRCCGAARS